MDDQAVSRMTIAFSIHPPPSLLAIPVAVDVGAASEVDASVQPVAAEADRYRRRDQHSEAVVGRVDADDSADEEHVDAAGRRGHEDARALLSGSQPVASRRTFASDNFPGVGIEREEAFPVDNSVYHTLRAGAEIRVRLRTGKNSLAPADPPGFQVHQVEFGLVRLLLAAGSRIGGGAAQEVAVRKGD